MSAPWPVAKTNMAPCAVLTARPATRTAGPRRFNRVVPARHVRAIADPFMINRQPNPEGESVSAPRLRLPESSAVEKPIVAPSMSLCPLRSELEDLIAGRLAAERHRELDGHIAACTSCQATLETLAEPQDAFLSAVHELATLAVHSASPPLQQAIDRIKLLPHAAEPAPAVQESTVFADHTLGDFRIARQVGRGGMGIVYEAQQISLGRKVALKTLPFAGLLDPRRLQRFQNEARAAASLEDPHIVPVYAVGVDRSVYYYAMRFIDGPNLSEIIDQLCRRMRLTSRAGGTTTSTATLPPTLKAAVGPNASVGSRPRSRAKTDRTTAHLVSKMGTISIPTVWNSGPTTPRRSPRQRRTTGVPVPADRSELSGPQHIRRVVRHMIQAARAGTTRTNAESIAHQAHQLMLDGALWITDFGLAGLRRTRPFRPRAR